MTITLELPDEVERRLVEQANELGLDPADYIVSMLRDLAQPVPEETGSSLSISETELLESINLGFSQQKWERYHQLIEQRENEALGPGEQDELIAISDKIESVNVQRVGYLVQLARLRKQSLTNLMTDLGISSAPDAGHRDARHRNV